MKRSKDIFLEMQEEEAYLTCIIKQSDYNAFNEETRSKIGVSTIQQLESREMKDNDVYKGLIRNVEKAKKDLRDFKFDYFNK